MIGPVATRAGQAARRYAACAAVCAVAGTAALAVAVAATAAGYGYVSEAGAEGAPLGGVYRAGILAVAVALALLAASLGRRQRSGPLRGPDDETSRARLVRLAAVALAGAAPLAATSGAVPCTPGCPLPPYETPGRADLVHAGASIGAVLLAAAAMVLLAAAPAAGRRLRRISQVGAGIAVPLLGAAGLAILVIGRGYVTGVLERAALVAALCWLAVAATATATDPADRTGPGG